MGRCGPKFRFQDSGALVDPESRESRVVRDKDGPFIIMRDGFIKISQLVNEIISGRKQSLFCTLDSTLKVKA